jgi:hypothetical protein
LHSTVRERDPELREKLAAGVAKLVRNAGYEVRPGDELSIVGRTVRVDGSSGQKKVVREKRRRRWLVGEHDLVK